MLDSPFQSLDLPRLRRAMDRIHEQVANRHGRVELTRSGCDDVCVILSKAELESPSLVRWKSPSRKRRNTRRCAKISRALPSNAGHVGRRRDFLRP